MGDTSGSIALLIIADDLTGANDAGVQFAKRGIASVVLVEPEVAELPAGFEVVVVNTESRHVSPDEAALRVRRVAQLGVDAGVAHFFKKTDSTLRGNIGAELKALLEVVGERSIPFVPAFPELGRTTRAGIHYVHGTPIAQTAFANDPLSPVCESEVAKVLNQTSDLRVSIATLGSVPMNDGAGDCVVFDCESRADLKGIVEHFHERNQLRVLSGSAAFAEELPGVLSLKRNSQESIEPRGPILFVNGSLHPRAFEQVAAAREKFFPIRLDPQLLLGRNVPPGIASLVPNNGPDVLLETLEKREDYEAFQSKARKLGIKDETLHLAVAKGLGQAVKGILKTRPFHTLIVFGGDSLIGIARAMNWKAFRPHSEVALGITVAKPIGSEMIVISKAGGFGERDVVHAILRWIRTSSAGSPAVAD
ncbi:MAG: four-carbon acid sugar kinase family protein [Limisphaerales bacterium]